MKKWQFTKDRFRGMLRQIAPEKFYTLFYTHAPVLVGIGRFWPELRSSIQGDFPSGAVLGVVARRIRSRPQKPVFNKVEVRVLSRAPLIDSGLQKDAGLVDSVFYTHFLHRSEMVRLKTAENGSQGSNEGVA